MNSQFYDQDRVRAIIEAYCSEKSITEAEFAKLIGAHPTHLSRIKAGTMCSPALLQKIATLGGVQVRELIRDEIPENIRKELSLSGATPGLPIPA